MAKSRSTFGKMQREQEKKSRAKDKLERREARKNEEPEETEPVLQGCRELLCGTSV